MLFVLPRLTLSLSTRSLPSTCKTSHYLLSCLPMPLSLYFMLTPFSPKSSFDGVTNAARNVDSQVTEGASNTGDIAKDTASSTGEGAQDAGEKAQDNMKDTASSAGEGAQEAGRKTQEDASSIPGLDQASDAAGLVGESLKEGAGKARETAQEGMAKGGYVPDTFLRKPGLVIR